MEPIDTSSAEEQQQAGYFHTLHEILQRPETWLDTCDRLIPHAPLIAEKLDGVRSLVLTGSGSSLFAAECVRPLSSRNSTSLSTQPMAARC
jgi:tagatose-6-phosphate ketose/aldose isomerase